MFHIRPSSTRDIDPNEWHEAMSPYREHLAKLRVPHTDDLWRYFANDFFHDGIIGPMQLDDSMQRIRFTLECPNIRRRIGEQLEWNAASFRCEITGVAHFAVRARHWDELNDPLDASSDNVTFWGGEVDSLVQEIEDASRAFGRDFHSLVIETIPVVRSIEVVFERISVLPLDVPEFDAMCRSSEFIVPWPGDTPFEKK